MRILHVTPHLPPYQAANALLPDLLGREQRRRGHEVGFLTLGSEPDAADVVHVRRRRFARWTRLPQALEAFDTWRKGGPPIRAAELIHVHSNTWMNQIATRLATAAGRPYVLTHYGTEIWHHDGRGGAFHRMNAAARHVTFYSKALEARAHELGVPFRDGSVVYPPVADVFRPLAPEVRAAVRARHAPGGEALLLNVKRLHPTADQATLLDAFAALSRRDTPAARLLVAGSGELEGPLKEQASRLGIAERVGFLGLIPNTEVAALQSAADAFVLSSRLEATPTVLLEALACGTPAVSTDNPGGIELAEVFGEEDVRLVPLGDPEALAAGMAEALASPRRVRQRTLELIEERFRPAGAVERYQQIYERAVGS
jgi:glycosyltransferase involved in cell wall biosynthesis